MGKTGTSFQHNTHISGGVNVRLSLGPRSDECRSCSSAGNLLCSSTRLWRTEYHLFIRVLSWYERQLRLHKSGIFFGTVFVTLLKSNVELLARSVIQIW